MCHIKWMVAGDFLALVFFTDLLFMGQQTVENSTRSKDETLSIVTFLIIVSLSLYFKGTVA
jgi:hypothetical protein